MVPINCAQSAVDDIGKMNEAATGSVGKRLVNIKTSRKFPNGRADRGLEGGSQQTGGIRYLSAWVSHSAVVALLSFL